MAKQDKADLQAKMSKLAEYAQQTSVNTPLQEVRPIEPSPAPKPDKPKDPHEGETHVSFWGESGLIEEVKVHAARRRKTIKQICHEALRDYLDKHK